MPGSLTSRIRQLGASLRGLDKNSCAAPKDLECRPTDSSSSWRDSRTSLSSSTMNTVGTSCVLITPRLGRKGSQNQSVTSFILSSPINRQLTPDRLYRRMQSTRAAPLANVYVQQLLTYKPLYVESTGPKPRTLGVGEGF